MSQMWTWLIRVVVAALMAVLIATQTTLKSAVRVAFIGLAVGLLVALFVPNALFRGIGGAVACASAGAIASFAMVRQSASGGGFWGGLSSIWAVAWSSSTTGSSSTAGGAA